MPSNAPLCLLYRPDIREWEVFQTSEKTVEVQSSCAVFLRRPTPEEEAAVRLSLTVKPRKVLYLDYLLPSGLQEELESLSHAEMVVQLSAMDNVDKDG